jgi:hypothetical protein
MLKNARQRKMMQKEREKQRPLVRSCVMEEKSGQESRTT